MRRGTKRIHVRLIVTIPTIVRTSKGTDERPRMYSLGMVSSRLPCGDGVGPPAASETRPTDCRSERVRGTAGWARASRTLRVAAVCTSRAPRGVLTREDRGGPRRGHSCGTVAGVDAAGLRPCYEGRGAGLRSEARATPWERGHRRGVRRPGGVGVRSGPRLRPRWTRSWQRRHPWQTRSWPRRRSLQTRSWSRRRPWRTRSWLRGHGGQGRGRGAARG